MLSHIRLKSSASDTSSHAKALQELYGLIIKDRASSPVAEPPAARLNPFVSFRAAAADTDDEDDVDVDDDHAISVYKQLQIGESVIVGTMLMSDGSKIPADRYANGDQGFIVCHWQNGETLLTDIPNMYLAPQGAFILKPIVQPQPAKPKAAPKSKAPPTKRPAANLDKPEDCK